MTHKELRETLETAKALVAKMPQYKRDFFAAMGDSRCKRRPPITEETK